MEKDYREQDSSAVFELTSDDDDDEDENEESREGDC